MSFWDILKAVGSELLESYDKQLHSKKFQNQYREKFGDEKFSEFESKLNRYDYDKTVILPLRKQLKEKQVEYKKTLEEIDLTNDDSEKEKLKQKLNDLQKDIDALKGNIDYESRNINY